MPKTRQQLSAEYLDRIGYDPFVDDPDILLDKVEQTLAEYDEIAGGTCLVASIGRAEIYLIDGDYLVYGVTASGDPRVCHSEGMAREIASGVAA